MNYQELSIKKLGKENKKLYEKISKDYKFDCVIFIAKGAYLIGKDLAEFANAPLLEIYASRKGGKLKKLLRPILQLLPEKLKVFLRKKEMTSNVHDKNPDRQISFDCNMWSKYKKCKKIIIVDDSIDTGYSALLVKDTVSEFFKKAEVKVAVLNHFEKADNIFKPDYYLYKNTMLKGPWSNDSNENKEFLNEYEQWKELVNNNA